MPADTLPPQNLAAESALIGEMLIDPEVIDVAEAIVTPDDFYADVHQDIARTLLAFRSTGRKTDAVSVAEDLVRRGCRAPGGDWMDTLADLMRSVTHVANSEYHAQIVRQKATARALIEAANAILKDAYGTDLSADEMAERAESRIFTVSERAAGSDPSELIGPAAREAFEAVVRRSEGEMRGVPTGLAELDAVLDGLQPGALNILAARPSMGKSLVALQFARHAAMNMNIPAVFFSLEMPKRDLAARLMTSMARINGHKIQTGKTLGTAEMHAWGKAFSDALACGTFWVKQANRLTPEKVLAESRRLKRRHGLGLIVIDYLQLLDPPADLDRRAPRHEQVAVMTRRLKTAAMDLDLPILCLAQLNRESEKRDNKVPRVSDLRESGAAEQDADVIMLLHRPGEYDKTTPEGHLDLFVGKNRNGPKRVLEFSIRMDCGVVEPRGIQF
jgi:replicative DNA helicase